MTIPVGQYYTGSNMRLVFVNDNDAAPTSTSTFSRVHVCKTICTDGMIDPDNKTQRIFYFLKYIKSLHFYNKLRFILAS